MDKRREEKLFRALMLASLAIVLGSLFAVVVLIVWNGLPALSWSMITQAPKGGYYLGKEGGVLNAIVGSLYLGLFSTALAFVISLPAALALLGKCADVDTLEDLERLRLDIERLRRIPGARVPVHTEAWLKGWE